MLIFVPHEVFGYSVLVLDILLIFFVGKSATVAGNGV
jgi:hypothetical protein